MGVKHLLCTSPKLVFVALFVGTGSVPGILNNYKITIKYSIDWLRYNVLLIKK